MTVAAHAYAQPSDVYRECNLGARTFVSRARPLDVRAGDAFDPLTGTFTLEGHGYESGDRIRFVQVAAGALPTGATATPVYVLPIDFFRFQIAATDGGDPLTFADAGSGWGVQVDPEARLLRLSRSMTAIVDECLTAHATPLKTSESTGRYPEIVIGVVARMVGRRYLSTLSSENAGVRTSLDTLRASAAFDGDTDPPAQPGSLLGDWKMGKPIYPQPTDQNSVPDNTAWGNGRCAQGWLSRGVM
jgi:hypothetical protein